MSSEPDRRLHPISLLFNLGARLWDLAIPLVVGLFAARSDTKWMVISATAAGIAAITAVLKYLSYRYRYDEDDLVVRTGLFFRNERHIPYDRIQNVDAVQNVAHRFFSVAVVQVQTGSGSEPEATLSVLPMSELAEMRRRVLDGRRLATVIAPPSADVITEPIARPAPTRLLHIAPRELMLAGFIENRGMALVAAVTGVLWQGDVGENLIKKTLDEILPDTAPAWAQAVAGGGTAATIFTAATMLLLAVLSIRLLSTVWAVIRLHEFTVVRDGNDLRTEYGLFTRVSATIPLRRVQTISIHRRWLHRKLGRAAIRVTTAGASGIPGEDGKQADREWLAPIIHSADIRRLIQEIDPSIELDGAEWTPAHPRAARRLMRISGAWAAVITGVSVFVVGWWSLAVAAILGLRAVVRARGTTRHLGCAIVGDRIAFRSGWFHHVVSVARFERIQSAVFGQTLFDRRTGMASVGVDTAGMGEAELSMPYLPEAVALRLHTRLTDAAVRTPFTW